MRVRIGYALPAPLGACLASTASAWPVFAPRLGVADILIHLRWRPAPTWLAHVLAA